MERAVWRGAIGCITGLTLALLAFVPVTDAQTTPPTTAPSAMREVEQWDIFELALQGPDLPNAFDVKLSAEFRNGSDVTTVKGFYDGEGVYRIRFMPPAQGEWRYTTRSELAELDGKTGAFSSIKPSANSHGPVRVSNTFHFAYADGTRFIPISTTLYGWLHQRSLELQEQTLESLRSLPFNRVRMMVFPINYQDDNIPNHFPFEESSESRWNYARFNPKYFQHIETRLRQLRDMGIEAELILFHNRDGRKTDLDRMPPEVDDRYIRYVVARFSAFRNVWWSLANEFDAVRTKRAEDWDRFFQILEAEDPVQHLRTVHQMVRYYDFNKPWVHYLSVQSSIGSDGFGRGAIYRNLFRKPVIFDEVQYEGDIPQSWGRLSGETMTLRFWTSAVSGTYVAHGETFSNAPGIAWISRGGKTVGTSPARIAFLRQILEDAPGPLNPADESDTWGISGYRGQYFLVYFGRSTPAEWEFRLPARPGVQFQIEVIDTWNMTITPFEQTVTTVRDATGDRAIADPPVKVPLGGKPYMALRIKRVEP